MRAGWPQHSDPAASDPGAREVSDPGAARSVAAGAVPRYGPATVVGRGGMGRVDRVHDAVLGRDVARKTLLNPSVALAERLRREARLCARLDHPGIVPVHDFHDDGAGSPWYTMRLVRGRTLGDAVGELDGLQARLRLVPRVLQAAQAVAHAHDRGIVHRDLKPANILLGPHGETLVVDWGLARALDEEDEASVAWVPADPQLTQLGAVIGTPAWMSPEQGRGEPAGRAADVYSLGRLLRWLLDAGAGSAAPRDLQAIADKATADDPAQRYPDAGAFALELDDWVAGRPVAAHDYSARELAARFLRTFRAPLLVGTAAMLVLTVGLTLAFRRAAEERDRALLAEEGLRGALAAERANSAAIALRRGDLRQAQALARDSLALAPSTAARGLLAAATAGTGLTRAPVLACGDARIAPDGASAICTEAGALRWRSLPGGEELARIDLDALPGLGDVAILQPGGPLAALSGGHLVRVARGASVGVRGERGDLPRASLVPAPVGVDVAIIDQRELWLIAGQDVWRERCPGEELALAITPREDGWLLACSGGTVREGRGAEAGRSLFHVPSARLSAVALVGDRLALGTLDGDLLVVSATDGRLALPTVSVASSPVRSIAVSPSGALLAVRAETGAPQLRSASGLGLLASLPEGARSLRFVSDGVLRAGEGDEVVDYTLGSLRPAVLVGDAGLSAIAWSAAAGLALGDGSGLVTVFADDGALRRSVLWPGGVVKDLAFDATGALWSSGVGLESIRRSRGDDPVQVAVHDAGARRIAPMADGSLLFASWRPRLDHWFPDGRVEEALGSAVHDLASDATGRRVLVAPEVGPATLLSLDAPPRPVGQAASVARVALDPSGRYAVLAGATLQIIDLDGATPPVSQPLPPDATALAASEDTVIVGFLDGWVRAYDLGDGRLLGEALAHSGRVSDVAVGAGRAYTAAWDATARAWELSALR